MNDDSSSFQLFSKVATPKAPQRCPDQTLKSSVEIQASPEEPLAQVETFEDLGISLNFVRTLKALAIRKPSLIQAAAIPYILKDRHFIGSSNTGTGKTAAFAIPIIQKLSVEPYGIFALVLTPTRELAFQIAEQFKVFGKDLSIRVSTVTGGMDMMEQSLELSRVPHVVIGTPGRILDLMQSSRDVLRMSRLAFFVLDEADRMLQGTLRSEVMDIYLLLRESLEEHRRGSLRCLLFSATMTVKQEDFAFLNMQNPASFYANQAYEPAETIEQRYLFIPSRVRECYLAFLLQHDFSCKSSVIVFVARCKTCKVLSGMLQKLQISCAQLHSRLSQRERIESLARFKGARVPILLTTDVGSRGLDIPDVDVVINYDLPNSAADYIHRIGRTGRAGKEGFALSFISEHDIEIVQHIESKTKHLMKEYPVSEQSVLLLLNKVSEAKRKTILELEESEE